MIITEGNVIKIPIRNISTGLGSEGIGNALTNISEGNGIKIVEYTSITFEVTISGDVVGGSYYNESNFPLYPFFQEGISGEVKTYSNKAYKYDSFNKRWQKLELQPFGVIGTKNQIKQSGNQFYKFTGIDALNPAWNIQSVSEMQALTFPFGKDIALWNNGFGAAIGDDNKKRVGIVYIKDLNGIAKGSVYSWDSIEYRWVVVKDYMNLTYSQQIEQNINTDVNGFTNDGLEGPIKEFLELNRLEQYLTK